MNTGLPLMPAITPVLSRGPPSRRARITLCRGPRAFSSTPRTRTLNSSMRLPSKTVRPVPVIPGRIFSNGKMLWARAGESGTSAATRVARGSQGRRMFIFPVSEDLRGARRGRQSRLDAAPNPPVTSGASPGRGGEGGGAWPRAGRRWRAGGARVCCPRASSPGCFRERATSTWGAGPRVSSS